MTTNGEQHNYGMPVHPLCAMLPSMSELEFHDLQESIKKHGLITPVIVHHGELVDGRHRIRACRAAQVEPRSVEWRDVYDGNATVAEWIWAMNERRNLTQEQRVMLRVEAYRFIDLEAAKIKQIAAGKEGGRGHKKNPTQKTAQGLSRRKREPDTRTKIAKEMKVSRHMVQQAIDVKDHQPELAAEVIQGKMPLREAAKQAKPQQSKQPIAFGVSDEWSPALALALIRTAVDKELKKAGMDNLPQIIYILKTIIMGLESMQ